MNELKTYDMRLQEIREIDESITNIKLISIEVFTNKKNLKFNFVCDKVVDDSVKGKMLDYITKDIPKQFTNLKISIKKQVADEDIIQNAILDFLKRNVVSISHAVLKENIKVVFNQHDCKVEIATNSLISEYINKNATLNKIATYLNENYCNSFSLMLAQEIIETDEINKATGLVGDNLYKLGERQVVVNALRKMPVYDINKLWGFKDEDLPNESIYIEDCLKFTGRVIIAGVVTQVQTRKTKSDKDFYLLNIENKTGNIVGKVFSTKEKAEKIKKVSEGSKIVTTGDIEERNGYRNYTIRSLAFCDFDEEFKIEAIPSKPCPPEYVCISPQSATRLVQPNLFDDNELPSKFIENEFVVFDLETTGLDVNDGDRITEIGAVKIINGKIAEKFTTLINPQRSISEKASEISGITDEMVIGKPAWKDIAGDFYKFCYGAVLVAHNISFDFGFIRTLSRELGYDFSNKLIDTLTLSRELMIGLKNYKLNTVCEQFGIEFHHHRAYSDAFATAELFIELIMGKNACNNKNFVV